LAGAFLVGTIVFDLGDLGLVAGRAKCWRASERWVAWVRGLVDLALARLGWGATVAASRMTSVAGLSSRRPRKAAWRTRLSEVQVAKRTWATREGRTQ